MRRGQIAPRRVTRGLRQRAWWMMRRHGIFTLPELLSTLATGTERAAASNLAKYLRALAACGILKTDGRSVPEKLTSNGSVRYRLLINNGRNAPVWRVRVNQVFDPNDGTLYTIGDVND